MSLYNSGIYFSILPNMPKMQHFSARTIFSREIQDWNCLEYCRQRAFEREMEQKQFYCLNKIIDLVYEKKKRKFCYFLLFNSILKSRFRGHVSESP